MSKNKNRWSNPFPSPLTQYPGTVSFPEHFTMPHYRHWRQVNESLGDAGQDARGISGAYGEDGAIAFNVRQWAHVLALATVSLDNLPDKALEDDTGESTPFEVLAWLIPLTVDYIEEKLNLKN